MPGFSSRAWGRWLLLLLGVLVLATYLAVLSMGGIEEALQWIEAESGTRGAFQQPGAVRGEGFVVLLAFLLLAPIAALVALFLALFVMMVLAGTLAPVGRLIGLPTWALHALIAVGVAALAYAESAWWLPWALWTVGVTASAFLSVLP